MKRIWHFFVLLTLVVNLAKGDPEFNSIQPARCRKRETDLLLNGLSWRQCLKSCRERPHCLAVSYQRSFHLCVLNYGGNSNFFNNPEASVCIGFMYAEKQFWNEKGVEECTENGVADVCSAEDCRRHRYLQNGEIHGNMFTIGSRLKVSCNAGFTLVGADQYICNEDGQWVNATGYTPTMQICAKDSPVFVSANQTTTHGPAEAYLAIDGNVNSDFSQGSCSHTVHGHNDVWIGQLETTSIVRGVAIYNRGDCCRERLNDFSVFVGTQQCAHFQGEAGAIVNVTCSTGSLVGNSVTIRQNTIYGLTLCEVIVF